MNKMTAQMAYRLRQSGYKLPTNHASYEQGDYLFEIALEMEKLFERIDELDDEIIRLNRESE